LLIFSLGLSIICRFYHSPDRISDEGCTHDVFVQTYYLNSSNMDSQTRRIPPSEWEIWKATILDLTRQKANTRKKVMAIMKEKYDFNARYLHNSASFHLFELTTFISAFHNTNRSSVPGDFARTSLRMSGQMHLKLSTNSNPNTRTPGYLSRANQLTPLGFRNRDDYITRRNTGIRIERCKVIP
jgi:Clr5 domain